MLFWKPWLDAVTRGNRGRIARNHVLCEPSDAAEGSQAIAVIGEYRIRDCFQAQPLLLHGGLKRASASITN
jgi:hypothetical protein